MSINEVFGDGKNIEAFLEQLEEIIQEDRYYLIDILPMTVQDPEKYSQFELVWEYIVEEPAKQKVFLAEEDKFVSLFKKVWLYNKTKAYVYESDRSEEALLNLIHKDAETLRWIKESEDKTRLITDVGELELLVRLGTRDIVDSILVFEDMEIVCWSGGGLAWPIYVNKPDVIELVKEMANVEGLYLYRKA
ncbi:hypothetical protein G7K71_08975 [Desulfofundulus sp. TPOSR]|uniref:hypothetical protein n=1 Tax=Desulfofundulus sp. TPOSR TaxID=2714340 RepID=UPI001409C3FB|nr:hypothetical protein [Desulfofundulus sp. TPOSR]NHM27114.1 hypothetical protein [Desulfofundulus sp. TPOSR]NPV30681.1 hypothetical protein [Bacillota bacterium]